MKHTEWCNCTDLGIDHYEECTCGAYYDVILLGEEVVEQRAKIAELQAENERLQKTINAKESAKMKQKEHISEKEVSK